MKRLYSTLIAILACLVFAEPALADPGNTWDKVYDSGRFKVLSDFNNEAVLGQRDRACLGAIAGFDQSEMERCARPLL